MPHATYTVYETAGKNRPTVVASGLTTTSWTSGTLKAGRSYTYTVAAVVTPTWTTAQSAATAPLTIAKASPYCA